MAGGAGVSLAAMATRRRSKTSRAQRSKGRSGRRTTGRSRVAVRAAWRDDVNEQLRAHRPDALAILLVVVGVISALGIYSDLAGPFGRAIEHGAAAVLGGGRFLVPLALIVGALSLVIAPMRAAATKKTSGGARRARLAPRHRARAGGPGLGRADAPRARQPPRLDRSARTRRRRDRRARRRTVARRARAGRRRDRARRGRSCSGSCCRRHGDRASSRSASRWPPRFVGRQARRAVRDAAVDRRGATRPTRSSRSSTRPPVVPHAARPGGRGRRRRGRRRLRVRGRRRRGIRGGRRRASTPRTRSTKKRKKRRTKKRKRNTRKKTPTSRTS